MREAGDGVDVWWCDGGGGATGLDASVLAPPFSIVSLQDIEVADADQ